MVGRRPTCRARPHGEGPIKKRRTPGSPGARALYRQCRAFGDGGGLAGRQGLAGAVTTAGTHVVEHQPMSRRTRDALVSIGLDAPVHHSRQVAESDVEEADLVIAMAAEHVRYMRRRHPSAADRTRDPLLACRQPPRWWRAAASAGRTARPGRARPRCPGGRQGPSRRGRSRLPGVCARGPATRRRPGGPARVSRSRRSSTQGVESVSRGGPSADRPMPDLPAAPPAFWPLARRGPSLPDPPRSAS